NYAPSGPSATRCLTGSSMIIVSQWFVRLFTFAFADAVALFPFIILNRRSLADDSRLMRHERIHLRQQAEMLVVFFYLWYAVEYLFRRLRYRRHPEAYRNISFEREAYANQGRPGYLRQRRFWAFLRYL